MRILCGKTVSQSLYDEMALEVATIEGGKPKLIIITASDDKASEVYVRNKIKKAGELGIEALQVKFDKNDTQQCIENTIEGLNCDDSVHGIIVQLPLYKHLDEELLTHLINPVKDVDGFHPFSPHPSCTPAGVMEILKHYDIPIEGKQAVVLGRSKIVGEPMRKMLQDAGATVTTCHSKTTDIHRYTTDADIVVSAIGRAKMLDCQYFNDDGKITIIDVGINRSTDGKLVGDVDFEDIESWADKHVSITPVPGGVGPMTICMLMKNTLNAWKYMNGGE